MDQRFVKGFKLSELFVDETVKRLNERDCYLLSAQQHSNMMVRQG